MEQPLARLESTEKTPDDQTHWEWYHAPGVAEWLTEPGVGHPAGPGLGPPRSEELQGRAHSDT